MNNLLILAFVVAASANLSKLADDVCRQDLRRKLCQKRFPKSVGLCMATHPNLNYVDHTNSVYLTGTNPGKLQSFNIRMLLLVVFTNCLPFAELGHIFKSSVPV